MSIVKPIEAIFNIEKSRRHWTNINEKFKQYFTEKILPVFDLHFYINDKSIPIKQYKEKEDDYTEDVISYNGNINLNAFLIGGYVYEYVFNADVNSDKEFFSPTGDVDISIKIPDIFTDDYTIVDISKMLESEFFNDILCQIIERLKLLDYNDLDLFDKLDNLSIDNETSDYFDKQNIRFEIAEQSISGNLVMQKIQIKICKNGIFEEIMDLMINFEMNSNSSSIDIISKECYDGVTRNIKYASKRKQLSDEISTLFARYEYQEVIIKTRNHLGRILFLLLLIDLSSNEADKYAAKSTCEYTASQLKRKLKLVSLKDVGKIEICNYKGAMFTFADMILPIKEYCLSKKSQVFIQIFS